MSACSITSGAWFHLDISPKEVLLFWPNGRPTMGQSEMIPWYSNASLRAKVYEVREPKPGLRHNARRVYVRHRFPVHGGVDFESTLNDRNPLLDASAFGDGVNVTFRGVRIIVRDGE